MPQTTALPFTDGWWPRIQWPYAVFGNLSYTVVDLRSNAVVQVGYARHHGWLNRYEFVVSSVIGDQDEVRVVRSVSTRDWSETILYEGRVGNSIAAEDGHFYWATDKEVFVDGQSVASGRFLTQSTRGHAGWVAVVEHEAPYSQDWRDYRVMLLTGGYVSRRHLGTQHGINTLIPTPTGGFTYGYFGPAFYQSPSGVTRQVNCTPRQGPPVVIDVPGMESFAIAPAEIGAATSGIVCGPLGDPRVAQQWDVNATWVDAELVNGTIYVVSSGDRGQPYVTTFTLTEPRDYVSMPPPPVDPPPVDPEPPMPIPAFSWDNVSFASHSAPTVGSWPITCEAESVSVVLQSGGEDRVTYTRGEYQWPDVTTSTWGVIDGSIWAFLPMPDGSWRGGTFDQMRPGQSIKYMERAYGEPYALDFDQSYQIKPGDYIGYMISTPARGKVYTIDQRTPVVVIKYGTSDVVWKEDAIIQPPPDPPVDPDPPDDDWEEQIELRLAKLEVWAKSFKG